MAGKANSLSISQVSGSPCIAGEDSVPARESGLSRNPGKTISEKNSAAPRTIPSLNGVRAMSFLIVFVAHAGLDWIVPGRFGVDIFFLLSGYLITTLLIRERAKTGSISLRLFYIRRALRIFPPMYVIFGGTFLFLYLTRDLPHITTYGICSQLFYFQNYNFHGGTIPSMGPLWSLAVEEHFYLFFPPLMLLLFARFGNYEKIAKALLGLCGVILVWRCCIVAFLPNGMQWARDASDTRADSILFGCVLACLQQTPVCERIFTKKHLESYIVPASLVTLLLTFIIRKPVFRETIRYTMQGLAIGPLLYYVVHYPRTRVGKLLNTPWADYLGIVSYALYLLHGTVIMQVQRIVPNKLAAGVLSLPIVILLAIVIRLAVERPIEGLRARFRRTGIRSRQSRAVPLSSTHPSVAHLGYGDALAGLSVENPALATVAIPEGKSQ
jgi:peptidoglycan/LPS O-acetylase OafA/YrhL